MNGVYCNKCFQLCDPFHKGLNTRKVLMWLFKCEHAFCKQCLQRICPLCQRVSDATRICERMPPKQKELFEPVENVLQRYRNVLRFQIEQEKLVMGNLSNTIFNSDIRVNRLQNLMRLGEELRHQIGVEESRIAALRSCQTIRRNPAAAPRHSQSGDTTQRQSFRRTELVLEIMGRLPPVGRPTMELSDDDDDDTDVDDDDDDDSVDDDDEPAASSTGPSRLPVLCDDTAVARNTRSFSRGSSATSPAARPSTESGVPTKRRRL